MISIGDVLMLAGAIAFTYRSCTPRLKRTASLAAPLRVPEFRRVVAARFVSGVGDWLTQAAAVTWIYSETRSTAMVSIYLVLGIGAFVIGGDRGGAPGSIGCPGSGCCPPSSCRAACSAR